MGLSLHRSHLLEQLRADNTSGATALLDRAVAIMEAFAMQPLPARPAAFHGDLAALGRALIAAQPSMAVMISLVQYVLETCPETLSPFEARQQLRQALATFRSQTRLFSERLCQHALDVISPGADILTYSNSGTVVDALRFAHRYGRVRRVFLSESRPAFDGRVIARNLVESGLAVDYRIDMGLFECLPAVDVVLIGADAVFPDGLINKLGTHALVQSAHLHGVPVYSLCTSMKWLPQDARSLWHIEDHPTCEVWPEAPPALRISNRYFDTTPLGLLRGIVSESGILTPEQLHHTLIQRRLAPAMRHSPT